MAEGSGTMEAMSTSIELFLDCDPGIDDAIALGYLLCQSDVDIVGIAASGGNVPTAQVVRNTHGWLDLADRSDIPVHPGHDLPLARQNPSTMPDEPLEFADLTHGETGAGYARFPDAEPESEPESEPEPGALSADVTVSAAQAWVDAARAHPGELIGVLIGPATNLALALDIEPELPHLIKRLFIMGGAFNYRGNTRPTTEWNVTFDPEATARVIAAFGQRPQTGRPGHLPVIAPIEATEALEMTPERLESIVTDAGAVAAAPGTMWRGWLTQMGEALRFYFEFHESDGLGYLAHIHDPFVLACALGWAREPATASATASVPSETPVPNGARGTLPWAETVSAPVDVELTGTLTRGETVADWLGRWGRDANAEIIRTIDAGTFLDHLGATLTKGP